MRVVPVSCDLCHGSGLHWGHTCPACEGCGTVLLQSPAPGVYTDLDGRAVDVVDLALAAGLAAGLAGPSSDGSCPCGATVISTGADPCIFCGGYTSAQRADVPVNTLDQLEGD